MPKIITGSRLMKVIKNELLFLSRKPRSMNDKETLVLLHNEICPITDVVVEVDEVDWRK